MLSEEGLARIEPFFLLPRGVARVDDCEVISGIIHVIRNGLRWRAPTGEHQFDQLWETKPLAGHEKWYKIRLRLFIKEPYYLAGFDN
ncbi:MAG: hypothetical protein GDA39_06635 [Hyphomonadaceae bacterium]|nr:hypothetical protein [Hyphomonadaceae bacterium]MBC6412568.1 hypothetical protein [Hyphomonadaceae bacterium]